MRTAVVDGCEHAFAGSPSILEALRSIDAEVPALCNDVRVQPAGVCRLCLVSVDGTDRPIPSCSTLLQDGMVIRTDTPALENARRRVLQLLAWSYPTQLPARLKNCCTSCSRDTGW